MKSIRHTQHIHRKKHFIEKGFQFVWWNVCHFPHFELVTIFECSNQFLHQLGHLRLNSRGEEPPPSGQKKTRRRRKQWKYNTVLLTNWTEIKSLTEREGKKETNSINIYGSHLWHKYAAVGLATSFFLLNQITMETVQKGVGWGGHWLSIER